MSNRMEFPKKGKSSEEILNSLQEANAEDVDWRNGRTWSLVYHGGEKIESLIKEAYTMYMSINGLSPRVFPSLKKFETEVVAMATNLLGGGDEATGTMTSGGTESIMMAIKTYRDKSRKEKPHITQPEVILPASAHPAFHKACHFLDVKMVIAPLKNDYRVDVDAVRNAINDNTILIVGSAPAYPHGVIDPIEELATLALENDIGCHVDACLGGYFLPFLRKLGYELPNFDLSVSGVTSISADIHKYGYAAKGASTILYANRELRKYQFHVFPEWIGGAYASPAMPGTRPGGAFAAAWAVLNHLGEDGYKEIVQTTMETTKRLIDGIVSIPGMYILGNPVMSVFAFKSDTLDMSQLGDAMANRGWAISRMPDALHLMVTLAHEKIVNDFITDLKECVGGMSELKETSQSDVAIYGVGGGLKNNDNLKEQVINHLDKLLTFK